MKPPSFGSAFGLMVKNRRAELRMTQPQLAVAVWPACAGDAGESRKGDISKLETGHVPNPHESTVLAIVRALKLDMAAVNALRLTPPHDPYALAGVLDNLKAASQADLYRLSEAFGMESPQDRSDGKLRAFLADKAKEYHAYRAQIESLDDRVAAIANLKGAAQDAAGRLDFEEVETLLARVQIVELEIAATTTEARAANALLRGRVEQAHALLSACADSFAAADPLEAARRRRQYGGHLYDHGLRYGGPGLSLAIRLFDRLLQDLPPDGDGWLMAASLNSRAGALRSQGDRTAGAGGAALLARAVEDYTQALTVFTQAEHPVDWAATLQNRAIALRSQGNRTAGAGGAALLARAVEDYTLALTVRTPAEHPVDWAMTRENMAILEVSRAGHDSCPDPLPHLRAALEHVEAALTVFNPDHMSYNHAKANALRTQILAALAANP